MPIQRNRGRGASLTLVVSVLVVVSSACAPVPRPGSGNFTARVISNDGAYTVGVSRGVLTVRNGGSRRGADTRIIVTESGSPGSSVCATIKPMPGGLTAFAQPGVALHVRTAGGRTTAITLTNNVLWGARWNWNVHYMDSGRRPTYALLGSISAPGFYRQSMRMPALPWRVCARTIGNSLQGKIWKSGTREPAWGDPNFGGSVTLPRGLATGGESGVFAGHLSPGQQLNFGEIGHY